MGWDTGRSEKRREEIEIEKEKERERKIDRERKSAWKNIDQQNGRECVCMPGKKYMLKHFDKMRIFACRFILIPLPHCPPAPYHQACLWIAARKPVGLLHRSGDHAQLRGAVLGAPLRRACHALGEKRKRVCMLLWKYFRLSFILQKKQSTEGG